jgi:hypothetical protein
MTFKNFVILLVGQPDPSLALGAFLLGLVGNVLATVLGEWELWGISGNIIILVVLAISVITVYILFYRLRRPRAVVEMHEEQPTGKAGLILLLSTLDPRARGAPDVVKRRTNEVLAAVDRILSAKEAELNTGNFDPLLGTNLEPAFRALEFHYRAGTLRECWMIGTPDESRPDGQLTKGSAWLSEVLKRWFNYVYPQHQVRFPAVYEVGPRDYIRLWNTVDTIFQNGPYRPDSVICDITGGLKLMSVGAALACMAEERTMQYMATDRDAKGEPIPRGELAPVLVDINPYLVWAESG